MDKLYIKLEKEIQKSIDLALDKVISFLKENNKEYFFDKTHLINLRIIYYDEDCDVNTTFMKGVKLIDNELYIVTYDDKLYNYKNDCSKQEILKVLREIENYF